MLGKQMTRAGSFTMVHATVLSVALGAACILGPAIKDASYQLSRATVHDTMRDASGPRGVVIMRATVIKFWDCDTSKTGVDA